MTTTSCPTAKVTPGETGAAFTFHYGNHPAIRAGAVLSSATVTHETEPEPPPDPIAITSIVVANGELDGEPFADVIVTADFNDPAIEVGQKFTLKVEPITGGGQRLTKTCLTVEVVECVAGKCD